MQIIVYHKYSKSCYRTDNRTKSAKTIIENKEPRTEKNHQKSKQYKTGLKEIISREVPVLWGVMAL